MAVALSHYAHCRVGGTHPQRSGHTSRLGRSGIAKRSLIEQVCFLGQLGRLSADGLLQTSRCGHPIRCELGRRNPRTLSKGVCDAVGSTKQHCVWTGISRTGYFHVTELRCSAGTGAGLASTVLTTSFHTKIPAQLFRVTLL